MGKPINKYRYVEYTDDGCHIEECLMCKARWEIRYMPTVFCPSCGVKFDGKLEWEEEKCGSHRKYLVKSDTEALNAMYVPEMRLAGSGVVSAQSWQWVRTGGIDWMTFRPELKGITRSFAYCLEQIRESIREDIRRGLTWGGERDLYWEYRIVLKNYNAVLKEFPVALNRWNFQEQNGAVAQLGEQ